MILSHPPQRIFALAVLALLPLAALAEEPIPPPAQTPAQVIVSGRTSTPREIKIVGVGDKIPTTYSGNRVKNTPGFTWYVSQHYALKTDYPEEKARFYLKLVELAYPHYVELFGKEPAGIQDKRMAIVYASSEALLKKALLSDGIAWDSSGGGITYEGYNSPISIPAARCAIISATSCCTNARICFNTASTATCIRRPPGTSRAWPTRWAITFTTTRRTS